MFRIVLEIGEGLVTGQSRPYLSLSVLRFTVQGMFLLVCGVKVFHVINGAVTDFAVTDEAEVTFAAFYEIEGVIGKDEFVTHSTSVHRSIPHSKLISFSAAFRASYRIMITILLISCCFDNG